ncbi:hypothetical protein GJ496_002480 [Pomphorhynchus laevis]|nr:hypothetical protein GJ496_002480 [Pomphorhynchus laevis]
MYYSTKVEPSIRTNNGNTVNGNNVAGNDLTGQQHQQQHHQEQNNMHFSVNDLLYPFEESYKKFVDPFLPANACLHHHGIAIATTSSPATPPPPLTKSLANRFNKASLDTSPPPSSSQVLNQCNNTNLAAQQAALLTHHHQHHQAIQQHAVAIGANPNYAYPPPSRYNLSQHPLMAHAYGFCGGGSVAANGSNIGTADPFNCVQSITPGNQYAQQWYNGSAAVAAAHSLPSEFYFQRIGVIK